MFDDFFVIHQLNENLKNTILNLEILSSILWKCRRFMGEVELRQSWLMPKMRYRFTV